MLRRKRNTPDKSSDAGESASSRRREGCPFAPAPDVMYPISPPGKGRKRPTGPKRFLRVGKIGRILFFSACSREIGRPFVA